ncbi:pectinesterase family protein [Botryobacter ruber]|uniref:pectinesterase family protein n=1 Tax=Botryobacter ruber TaxID=2171629 RepID=UPI000E0B4085|nr:pectinesterase family protein [Botryobacter ruber]
MISNSKPLQFLTSWLAAATLLLVVTTAAQAQQVYNYVVAKDGSGDYTRIQDAISRVLFDKPTRTLIYIKDGVYEEKLYVAFQNISLIGESRDGVIISWNDYSGKPGTNITTGSSYTLQAQGNDFYAENLTIRNTAGNVGQAVAIHTTGQRQVFKNCRFLGFQDTYYAQKGRQYNVDCFIEGATDFIFGDATALFENCIINSVQGGQYITAHNDTKLISTVNGAPFYHGLLFLNSTLTANQDVPAASYFLGRPWGAPGSTVFINTKMGSHIRPAGWSTWSGNNHLNGTFAEYQSKDLQGEPLDVSQRVTWSSQLTADMVANYYNLDYFLKKDNVVWNPREIASSLPAPQGLAAAAGYVLSWQAVDQAKGYVISRNGTVIGFAATPSYTDATADPAIANAYQVKAVANSGNQSAPSPEVTVQPTVNSLKKLAAPAFRVSFAENNMLISEKVNVTVYNLAGALVKEAENTDNISLAGMGHGAYVARLVNKKGQTVVKKFVFGSN